MALAQSHPSDHEATHDWSADDLIARYIHLQDADTPDQAIVAGTVSVAALILHLGGMGGNITETAKAWNVPPAAVEAAIAYYHRHRMVVDARIVLNVAQFVAYPAPANDRDDLIARFVRASHGSDDPVVALVAGTVTIGDLQDYLVRVNGDVEAAVAKFGLPADAVLAAQAYYARAAPAILAHLAPLDAATIADGSR